MDKLLDQLSHLDRSTCHSRHACEMVSRNPGISQYSPRTRATNASSGGIGPPVGGSEPAFVLAGSSGAASERLAAEACGESMRPDYFPVSVSV
jgi:hypothetical protein